MLRQQNNNQNMSLFEHIQDLRKHVLRAVLWIMAATAISCLFMSTIIDFLKKPYSAFVKSSNVVETSSTLTSINVFEVMTVNIKVCLLIGLCLSCPFVLYEIWRYVRPALYPSEKRFAKILIISSIFLFYSGVAFGYFLNIPYFLQGALNWASHYANVMITYESYFNTLTTMILIFGFIFEIPVVLSLLGLSGVINSNTLIKNRRIIFLGSFILGAILAPPDVFSLCLISLPMYGMIEVSILIIKYVERKKNISV